MQTGPPGLHEHGRPLARVSRVEVSGTDRIRRSAVRTEFSMRYVSTRGRAPILDFEGVLLAGLASDGGLYVPERWPTLTRDELVAFRGRDYADVAHAIVSRFTGDTIDQSELRSIVGAAYAEFGHTAVAPLAQLGPNHWLLELFHGADARIQGHRPAGAGPALRPFPGAPRRPHHDRRRHVGRHRLRRHRGDQGPRSGHDLHPSSGRPRLGGPAPADDDGRRRQRPQHRDRRDVRRLSGDAQGDVQRRRLSQRTQAVGG